MSTMKRRRARGAAGRTGVRGLRLRKASTSDVAGLAALWEEYYREMSKVIRIWTAPDEKMVAAERRRMRSHLRRGGKAFVVTDADDALVAMLWAEVEKLPPAAKVRRAGYVSQVYVKPEFRGRGLTRKMVRSAYRWFRTKGVRWASLYVMDDNRDAIDAWKKMGYGYVAHYMGRRI